jgi:hypothetical protein
MMTGLPGPCVICGGANYGLSCGGPTICPKCDCGHFDAATVEQQAKVIASLRAKVDELTKALEKLHSYNVDIHTGRINYRPLDHIQVINAALASGAGND